MTLHTRHIVIIGGGYSGVAFAAQALAELQASTTARQSLLITVIESQAELGRGIAYATADPDHRLNAPSFGHMALAHRLTQFHERFTSDGGLDRDPQAQVDGLLFPRRAEFGVYLSRLLRPSQAAGLVRHCRDRAVALRRTDDRQGWIVRTAGGLSFTADRVVLATGHLPPATPSFVAPDAAALTAYIDSPWNVAALASVPAQARVLLLGSGLTAADVVATLVRHGHRGAIDLVSRRGLRPQPLPPPADPPPLPIFERVRLPIPEFLRGDALPPTVRGLLRALRLRVRMRARDGVDWYEAFDDLRDAFWRLWPMLTPADQRRFQRHLKPWYDTYRYRMPPQTGLLLTQAESAGQLRHRAARVLSLQRTPGQMSCQSPLKPGGPQSDEPQSDRPQLLARLRDRRTGQIDDQHFDVVINCTGLGQRLEGADPLTDGLLADGHIRAHASGIGLDVDARMAAVNGHGQADASLRIVGPPSAGALGDAIGAVFICAHIGRMMPEFIASL